MTAPDKGGMTMLGLDDEGLVALKNVVMTASLYADELLSGDEQQKEAGNAMHEDIELICGVLGTDLDGLWHEFEQQRKEQFIEYARASTHRPRQ